GLVVLDKAAERLQVRDPLRMGGLRRLEIGGALGGEARLKFDRDGEVGECGLVHGNPLGLRVAARIALADGAGHAYLTSRSDPSMRAARLRWGARNPKSRGRVERPSPCRGPRARPIESLTPVTTGAAGRRNPCRASTSSR